MVTYLVQNKQKKYKNKIWQHDHQRHQPTKRIKIKDTG